MSIVSFSAGLAEAQLPLEDDKELAGPPCTATPVQRAERISSLDILRGFALLGTCRLNAATTTVAIGFNYGDQSHLIECKVSRTPIQQIIKIREGQPSPAGLIFCHCNGCVENSFETANPINPLERIGGMRCDPDLLLYISFCRLVPGAKSVPAGSRLENLPRRR